MTKRLMELDDELVERAQEVLGTATMVDTVREALAQVVDGDLGKRYVALLRSLDDLSDPNVMSGAWREPAPDNVDY